MRSSRLSVLLFAAMGLARAETPPAELAPLVVTAGRAPQPAATLPLTVDVYGGETLADAPSRALDDALRRCAAFSLFRRAGSLTANPTAQGVSLRGVGPSGAGRALVLLDGLPVNDPFGGWVAWTKLPASSLERVEIVRGGGSAAWGGSSLGGVVHLITRPLAPAGTAGEAGVSNAALEVAAGDFGTRAIEAGAELAGAGGRDAYRVEGAAFATDGVRLVRNPGSIDVPADSGHERGRFVWARRIDETTTLTASVRAWREERGNGTPYQRNASRELAASVSLAGAPVGAPVDAWSVAVYGQEQDFRGTFSSVGAARDVETPAGDQYAVPAAAAGFSAQASWGDASGLAEGDASVTTLGLDGRRVDGETRERFLFNGADFTRERRAGGEQTVAGLFATHARALRPGLAATLGARLDETRRSAGFRRETVRATGGVLRDDAYADRDDLAFSPGAGLAWRVAGAVTARAAAYSAYRTPTLNELYRPFRVGPITTLANPGLEPETLLGGEAGLAYAAPDASRGLRATVFQNDLADAVANVTTGPAARERRNLDSTRVRGLELGGDWRPLDAVRFEADYLLSDARVRSGGPGAAALDGRRLAQVPRHTLSAGVDWRAARSLDLDLRASWLSRQFEDDLNTLTLAAALRFDVAAHYAVTPRLRLTFAVENVFDAGIETARTAAGVVSVAPPRWARAELRYGW